MKLAATLKMMPDHEQAALLKATLERCKEACSWLAKIGFNTQTYRQYDLQRLAYGEMRNRFSLTAQAAVRCIAKVANAFKSSRGVAPVFRMDAAQSYDDRIIRFTKNGSAVNLWTVEGRITVPIVMGEHQRRLMTYRKGEVDLCFVRGKWFIAAICDVPETDEFAAEDWLGVDLGIVSLATDSDRKSFSGGEVERKRQRYQKRRSGLQKLATRGAWRKLRKLSGKQARFQKYTNHCIAKAVVSDAERTSRGIALEQLKGLLQRVTARSNQRARLGNWGFSQLGSFIAYKAKRAGVPVVFVDPRNTSRQCAECGNIDKKNRPNQATFLCVSCGHRENADINAARNIRQRGRASQGQVMVPGVLAV